MLTSCMGCRIHRSNTCWVQLCAMIAAACASRQCCTNITSNRLPLGSMCHSSTAGPMQQFLVAALQERTVSSMTSGSHTMVALALRYTVQHASAESCLIPPMAWKMLNPIFSSPSCQSVLPALCLRKRNRHNQTSCRRCRLLLDRQEQLELWWELLFWVQPIWEVDAPDAAVCVDLNS